MLVNFYMTFWHIWGYTCQDVWYFLKKKNKWNKGRHYHVTTFVGNYFDGKVSLFVYSTFTKVSVPLIITLKISFCLNCKLIILCKPVLFIGRDGFENRFFFGQMDSVYKLLIFHRKYSVIVITVLLFWNLI